MTEGAVDLDASTAARELLRRQRARRSLIEFARSIQIPGAPVRIDSQGVEIPQGEELFIPVESAVALHHRVMMTEIQRCMETYNGRLMILAPPGSAKSTYASVVAPAWAMGRWPGIPIILASYASDIADKQARKVRAIVRDPQYTSIWLEKPTLASDQRAVGDWALTNGSSLMSAGLLAGITGNRAGGLVIDDPISNREAADSETIRDKVYNEYIDTALTRAKPGMWVLLINTRWHEDDLSGRILPEDYAGESGDIQCQDGRVWRVLNIPAEAEHPDDPLGRLPGEFLWPEWFKPGHWDTWRNNPRAARTWSALYQQRPAPQQGVFFQRSMFKWYDPNLPVGKDSENCRALPANLRYYGASDYATMSERGDNTEHGVFGMDPQGNIFVTHWWFKQVETDQGIEAFINLLKVVKPVRWFNEGGLIDKSIRPAIRRRMRETQRFVALESMPSILDKGMKLLGFHARVSAGTVFFPMRRPWADHVVDQLVKFPAGKHDDAADVCGLIGRGLDQMYAASVPVIEERDKGLIPFTARWIEWNDRHEPPKVKFFS